MTAVQVNQRIKPAVPEENGGIKTDCGQCGAGQRQDDPCQDPKVTEAVNNGGFFYFRRDRFEEVDEDDETELIDRKREQYGPDGPRQMEIGNQQVIGNQTTREEHGEDDHFHDEFPPLELFFAERIGKEHHHGERYQGASDGKNQGITISPEKIWIAEHAAIGIKVEIYRPQRYAIVYDSSGRREGHRNDVQERNYTDKRDNDHNRNGYETEYGFSLSDLVFVFRSFHSSVLLSIDAAAGNFFCKEVGA